ncbi:MAG: heavy-metal-associated domain-containing protein [Bacilli bacterium]|nr:heavy-metal-associated domain-containing protein [Bacilli bacterium]MDD3389577.1 heavy-metal-associated domain-containing protein [Bacilli bacterium]
MNKTVIKVSDLHCQNCVKHVYNALIAISGVKQVEVDLVSKYINVISDENVAIANLLLEIKVAGYTPELIKE